MIKKGIICETLGTTDKLQINESKNGEIRLTGVFGVCGVKNNNNRIYEKKNYGECITEMQQRIISEGILGELEHPNSGNINLNNVSHKIESIQMNEDGTIVGTILLLNTAKGRDAKAIVEGGVPLFISSRASGSIDASGRVSLNHIQTYDLVGTPGFSQARLDLAESQIGQTVCLNESLEGQNGMYMIVESEEVTEPAAEEVTEPVAEEVTEPAAEEVTEPVAEEVTEPAAEEVTEPVAEEVTEPAAEEVTEPVAEPVAESVAEEVTEPVAEPVAEEVTEPVAEPVAEEAAEEATEKSDDEKSDDTSAEASADDNKKDMDEVKSLIKDLSKKIDSLESQLHVAQESLQIQDEIIENLQKSQIKPDVLQNWLVEEFAPEIQNWIIEEYSPEIQNWIIEEYSPEVQNWIVEEYTPEHLNQINEGSACTCKKCEKEVEEDEKDDKKSTAEPTTVPTKAPKKSCVSESFILDNMPSKYKGIWENLSEEHKQNIIESSKLYNFNSNTNILKFWESKLATDKVNNVKATETKLFNESLINSSNNVVNPRYAAIFNKAKAMQLR